KLEQEEISKTDDSFKYSDKSTLKAKVERIVVGKEFVDNVDENVSEYVGILLDRTLFYSESGGQINDLGNFSKEDFIFQVENVQIYGGYVLHVGVIKQGSIKINEEIELTLDVSRRKNLRLNHTATHILNYVLRETVGDGIEQKGSLVASDKLRFDFNLMNHLNENQLNEIQNNIQDLINKENKVYSKEIPLNLAMSISGLRAVFGEVYPDPVRVVAVGVDLDEIIKNPQDEKWKSFPIELCGGTHVSNSKEIQLFYLTEYSSIAKGIKRIVAVTGKRALELKSISDDFSIELNKLNIENISEKDLKNLSSKIDNLSLPLLNKLIFKSRIDELTKIYLNQEKNRKSILLKDLTNFANSILESDKPFYILNLSKSKNDKKILNSILDIFKQKNKPVILYSEFESKVVYFSFIPSYFNIPANDWLSNSFNRVLLNSKSGGKDTAAQGIFTLLCQKLDEFFTFVDNIDSNTTSNNNSFSFSKRTNEQSNIEALVAVLENIFTHGNKGLESNHQHNNWTVTKLFNRRRVDPISCITYISERKRDSKLLNSLDYVKQLNHKSPIEKLRAWICNCLSKGLLSHVYNVILDSNLADYYEPLSFLTSQWAPLCTVLLKPLSSINIGFQLTDLDNILQRNVNLLAPEVELQDINPEIVLLQKKILYLEDLNKSLQIKADEADERYRSMEKENMQLRAECHVLKLRVDSHEMTNSALLEQISKLESEYESRIESMSMATQ
ncbi:hypothetical protein ROZALSC1DRAFT_22490, partial [Rozella allomycis CSF55]